jgi:hypothetical protein
LHILLSHLHLFVKVSDLALSEAGVELVTTDMTSKPVIVFVPGAWHTPESFEVVASFLKEAGYDYEGITKPSSTSKPPFPTGFDEDIEVIRAAVIKAADAGRDVVLIMHSYGGIPGSAAAKGLSKEERAKEGKPGGLVRLMYISSFAIPEGKSLQDLAAEPSPWCQPDPATVRTFSITLCVSHRIAK